MGRFDDWSNDLLEECARAAGLDVPTYVARAVASQMLADLRRTESHSLDDLLTRLSAGGIFVDSEMPSTSAALTNPERLRALYATGLLDSGPEELYDRITKAAAAALDAPSAAVSLVEVDRQYFKSSYGMGITTVDQMQTPIDRSVCQYAVADGTTLILEDARVDPVFKNHPVVLDGSVVAYLGIPLMDYEGHAIGTLCVFDQKPRLWGTGHIKTLQDLADLTAERIFKSTA